MKAIATISTMILAAGMAAGQAYPAMASGNQAYPAQKPAAPASQSATAKTTTAKTTAKTAAAKPAAKPAVKTAAKTPAKPMAKPATAVAAKVAPAKKPAPTKTEQAKGQRDPFISPVVVRMGQTQGASCTTGKRCLIIDQLTVEGVVKTGNGWIAVIGNPARKVYYLRENDALFDGVVKRIAGDSVVFTQNIIDALGKSTTREVVKRISSTPAA